MADELDNDGGCRLNGVTVVLLQMSRACGAAPFTCERQRRSYMVRVSRIYAFIACCIAVIIGVMVLTVMLIYINIELTTDPLSVHVITRLIVRCVEYVLTGVIIVIATFGGSNRMHRFISYYQRMQKIYASAEINPMSRSLEKVLKVILGAGVANVVIMCGINIVVSVHASLHFQRHKISYIICKLLQTVHIISGLLILQIIFVATSALWTLTCLNRSIAGLYSRIQLAGVNRDDSAAVIAMIRRYASTYTSIIDMCKKISAREGFTMLLLLLEYAYRILAFAYFTTPGRTDDINGIWINVQRANQMCNFLRVGFLLVMLVEPCHRTHEELKRTQVLISQLLCVPPSALDDVSVALVRFYEVTEPCGYVYTYRGTFTFSRSLYTAFIGGLTTLIIIITHM